eukprot:TRINITY_DN141_c2_g1_i1.p1 TRINITY_DN141_c2_g1~~TRINITY_DN141_c2_g1_i1.p1  ORF type:complete len:186 (+),score=42.09 TRINITY_DN141_c2_g1_i1:102-659(+)
MPVEQPTAPEKGEVRTLFERFAKNSESTTRAPLKQVAYFSKCSGPISVNEKCLKIVLDACSDCTLTVDAAPITGCLEIVRCDGATVVVNVPVATITVDMSTRCRLVFPSADVVRSVVSNQCQQLEVSVAGAVTALPTDLSNFNDRSDWEKKQHLTSWDDGSQSIVTTEVIREGAGYLATQQSKSD